MAASFRPPHPAGPPFDSWVVARAHALTRFAYLLTGSAEQADQVVQQVLAAARPRWRRLASSGRLDARLHAMVVRAYLRRGRRRPDDRHPAAPPGDEDPWLPVPAAHEPDRDARAVWQRCAALPPRQRAALALCCHDEAAAVDPASVLGGHGRFAADLDAALAAVVPTPPGPGRDSRVAAVRRAFQQYADTASPAYAPAERATVRAARRRRRRVTTAATAGAALLLPALWVLAPRDAPTDPSPTDAPRAEPMPVHVPGWRWESWGGVQVRVPQRWGYGDLTQWCVADGPSGPAVDRPGPRRTDALCSLYDNGRPTYTGGLVLRRLEDGLRLSRADVAPYATTRIHTVGDVTLTVVDVDPAVAGVILASAQVIGRRDHNGCRPDRARERPTLSANRSPGGPVSRLGAVGSVSVCRYALAGWSRPTIVSSRRLTGRSAGALLAELRAAPVQAPSDAPGDCRGRARELAVLELWPRRDGAGPTSVVVRYDGCRGHGADDGLTVRGLTPGLLAPILTPPWSGEVTADVPLPRSTR